MKIKMTFQEIKEEKERTISSRDSGGDQLSEYDEVPLLCAQNKRTDGKDINKAAYHKPLRKFVSFS